MPFKFDSSGNIATTGEGAQKLPIFIHADGREAPFDADGTLANIGKLRGEAQGHREAKEAAEAALKPFKDAGITDPAEAAAALELKKNIGSGELSTAAQKQEYQAAAKKAAEEQVAAASKAHAEALAKERADNEILRGQLNTNIIGGGFARSKLITDEKHDRALAIPPDMAEAFFGRNFKVEDGKAVGYDMAGNKIFSITRPGEVADFDEALTQLVDRYPNKESILRGTGNSGSGAGGGGRVNGVDTSKMSAVEKLNAVRGAT
jgi:hypothetical protein